MIPVRLTISGFLSYRDEIVLDFDQFDLACISGANGSGKSSLLDSITWAVFGQARKRDDSIINLKSEEAVVEYIFDYETNRYRIQRSKMRNKSSVLEFQIQTKAGLWKPLTERTLRGTETKIEETLRLDYETFVNASFFLQGKADQFTQQRPGDRKRILSTILGLEIWETYRRQTFERRKLVDQAMTELDGRLQEIHNELAEEDSRKQRLAELESTLKTLSETRGAQEKILEEMRKQGAALDEQEKLVNTLESQLDNSRATLNDLQARLTTRQAESQTHQEILGKAKEIESAHKAWQTAQTTLEGLDKIAAQFREHDAKREGPRTEIETERARLEANRDQLQKQAESVSQVETEITTYQKQLADLQTQIDQTAQWKTEREKIETELEVARQNQADARAENPRLKAEMDDLAERIAQLKATEGATCPLCGQPLEEADRKRLITELEAEGKIKGDTYRTNSALLKQSNDTVADLETQIGTLKNQEAGAQTQVRQYETVKARLEQAEQLQSDWQTLGAKNLADVLKKLEKNDFAQEARKALASIDAELAKIGYDAASHDEIRQEVQANKSAAEQLRALETAKAALAPLEREIAETNEQIEKLQLTLKTQEKDYQAAVESLTAAKANAPDIQDAGRKMLAMQEDENRIRDEVGAARQLVNVLETQRKRAKQLDAEREDLARQIGQFKALERAFGKDGVPAMLIEQALPQIETKANEILERLSGGNMAIRFVTQLSYKDNKRDDLKETLDIQISDSAGIRDYEMYSGGEAFRINFAIRLALSEVLAQRAGARLQTLVIDEGFGSQDEAGRQRLIEAINLVKGDFAKILIITHIDSLKDYFPNRIEVIKTERGSGVTVV